MLSVNTINNTEWLFAPLNAAFIFEVLLII